MFSLSRDQFVALAASSVDASATLAIPVFVRLIADQVTPVVAYRRMVARDTREAPSFLLESVEGGERQGRYSILGAQPVGEVLAWGCANQPAKIEETWTEPALAGPMCAPDADPFVTMKRAMGRFRLVRPLPAHPAVALPKCFLGGWVGFAAYDSVRFGEPEKLPFSSAPRDDRELPDLHFGFYSGVVAFDHVDKTVSVVELGLVPPAATPAQAGAAYDRAIARIRARLEQLEQHSEPLHAGPVPLPTAPVPLLSNLTREQHASMVRRAFEYIKAGDIFQVVLGQRFERVSKADPFDVYRALRCVNPSPYMVYMQARGCILAASSPEILCRVQKVEHQFKVTNRPLAGTRKRGRTPEEDVALERDLLADAKERAEHIMLVDLGRNDVGVVAEPGSIALPSVMEVERYSHVMHISSTVTGTLREGLDCWDALRAALPVGTISGAPKVRAMQIIDELEPIRRGPYGGGMGCVGLDGQMDIALTLRTMVVPLALAKGLSTTGAREWTYHLQAAGGIVADSNIDDEYMETVNKSAALARAIDVAEHAFTRGV
jgi:anthranilate synthase component 1